MAVPSRPMSQNKYPEQYMQNTSFDEEFGVNTVETLEYSGNALKRSQSKLLAFKITESGTTTYVACAPTGSAQSSAVWQAKKIDESSGTVITWADGNSDFDNIATDLTALTYS